MVARVLFSTPLGVVVTCLLAWAVLIYCGPVVVTALTTGAWHHG